MAFTKINPPGWALGDKLLATQISALDTDHANSVDKTAAGDTVSGSLAFSAAGSAIVFGAAATGGITISNGSKLVSNGTLTLGATCVGTIANGGALTVLGAGGITGSANQAITANVAGGISSTTAGGGGISHAGGANDWINFSATRGYSVFVPAHEAILSCSGPLVARGAFGGISIAAAISTAYLYQGGFVTQVVNAASANAYQFLIPLRRPHHGATLASAVMYFTPAGGHAGLPNFPSIGIYRSRFDGTTVNQSLKSGTSYAQYSTGSLVTYNAGAALNVTLTCDQNNVIDSTNFGYGIYIWDESNTNALVGATYWGALLTYTSIATTAFPQ